MRNDEDFGETAAAYRKKQLESRGTFSIPSRARRLENKEKFRGVGYSPRTKSSDNSFGGIFSCSAFLEIDPEKVSREISFHF